MFDLCFCLLVLSWWIFQAALIGYLVFLMPWTMILVYLSLSYAIGRFSKHPRHNPYDPYVGVE